MLLECPVCATSYQANRADLEGGRLVICPRCDARWRVDAEGRRDAPAPARAIPRPREAPMPAVALIRPALAIAACLAASMLIIGARERVVRAIPRTASLYHAIGLPVNIRGLAFVDVRPERRDEAAAQVSIIGEIKNIVGYREHVPRLAYEVRDAAGAPLVSWTEPAPAKVIAAGKTLAFASVPHVLPEDARSVLVRFDDEAPPVRIRAAQAR
jgi:predicted Zn finger-like uncharacterized protein